MVEVTRDATRVLRQVSPPNHYARSPEQWPLGCRFGVARASRATYRRTAPPPSPASPGVRKAPAPCSYAHDHGPFVRRKQLDSAVRPEVEARRPWPPKLHGESIRCLLARQRCSHRRRPHNALVTPSHYSVQQRKQKRKSFPTTKRTGGEGGSPSPPAICCASQQLRRRRHAHFRLDSVGSSREKRTPSPGPQVPSSSARDPDPDRLTGSGVGTSLPARRPEGPFSSSHFRAPVSAALRVSAALPGPDVCQAATDYPVLSSAHIVHMPMSGIFSHLACPSQKAKLLPSLCIM